MPAELVLQAVFEDPFDHLGQESALAGQPQPTLVDTAHQVIEQAGLDHLIDSLASHRSRRRGGPAERAIRPLLPLLPLVVLLV
jgi:hypothetical protein